MQADRHFIIITILVLVLLSIFGLTIRALYSESPSSAPIESKAQPEEDRDVMETVESGRSPILFVLDLTRTPVQTQRALSFLLLVPVGVLITALARSVVGICTIGTFSPTLLALSQARSDWRMGIVIFISSDFNTTSKTGGWK